MLQRNKRLILEMGFTFHRFSLFKDNLIYYCHNSFNSVYEGRSTGNLQKKTKKIYSIEVFMNDAFQFTCLAKLKTDRDVSSFHDENLSQFLCDAHTTTKRKDRKYSYKQINKRSTDRPTDQPTNQTDNENFS